MSNNRDEKNRYVATEIMEIAGHALFAWDTVQSPDIVACSRVGCLFKGNEADVPAECSGYAPDYCSDESPRSLLNEVVAKVSATAAITEIGYQLRQLIFMHPDEIVMPNRNAGMALVATAEQIVDACISAHRAAKGD